MPLKLVENTRTRAGTRARARPVCKAEESVDLFKRAVIHPTISGRVTALKLVVKVPAFACGRNCSCIEYDAT